MKTFFSRALLLVFLSAWALPLSAAETQPGKQTQAAAAAAPAPPPSAPAQRSAAELEKLVMPIALHPDPLVAIILPASAYPLEIVQAARFVKDTNNIAKLDQQPWDENVKAVARFPELIAKMDADLAWTSALGQAFLDQPKELMDTIQALRAKAQKAGTLQTTPQQVVVVTNVVIEKTVEQKVVVVTNTVVQIEPSNPQVVYVPSYPPTVYYPPPAYVYDPYAPLVTFGVGLAVGAIIANNCDWHGGGVYVGPHGFAVWGGGHGDVDIDVNKNININQNNLKQGAQVNPQSGNRAGTGGAGATQTKWQPDQSRLRSSGAPASAQTREARGWSGGTQPSQRPATGTSGSRPSQLPSTATGGARPTQQAALGSQQRPAAGSQPTRTPDTRQASASQRPATPSGGARSAPQTSSFNRPSPQSSSAFSGMSSGANARSFASRGAASRGGGRGR